MLTRRESAGQDSASQCRENRGLGQSRRLCDIYKILRTTPQCIAAPSSTGAVLAPTWQSPFVRLPIR